jgi:hypothetical protein
MARISYTPHTEVFKLINRSSDAMGETNDCAVKAIALATNTPYTIAHKALKDAGRKNRKGSYFTEQKAAMRKLGFDYRYISTADFIARYPGRGATLKNVTTHHMDRYKKVWADGKTYLIYTRSHVGAVINGVNHDWTKGRSRRVRYILEVSKA